MKIYQDIVKKHSLTELEVLRKSDGGAVRAFVIKLKDEKGELYCLKLFDSEDNEARARFIDEIANIRYMRVQLSPKYRLWLPNIKWYSIKGSNPYYIYKYINSEPLGMFVEDLGIKWGYFSHANFPDFINFFYKLNRLDVSGRADISPRNWGYRSAQKELQHYFENVPFLLPSDLYDKIRSYLERSRKKAFERRVLSHRDLYPENILIEKMGSTRFSILDWEYLSYMPIGFDAAFLYLLFWREEYWKAKVISFYYNKYKNATEKDVLSTFVASFRFCLILLGIRFIYQISTFSDKDSADYRNAYLSFLYDIRSAVEGHIVKPKNIKFYIDLDDIKEVAKLYGIDSVVNYTVFYASKGNTVAKVETKNGVYVFRFYSHSRSISLISKELKIFETLSEGGIRTYNVLRSLKNELYVEHKLYGINRKIAVLTYIKGGKIKQAWANEKAAREAGHALRTIHDKNIIHGDFSKENVLFVKSKVTGVIDFEWGRFTKSRNAKFNDLAKALALWLIDIRVKKIEEEIFVREFLKGYYGDLPKKEKMERIASQVIDKIISERNIFFTTIDNASRANKREGKRFEHAIEKVKEAALL